MLCYAFFAYSICQFYCHVNSGQLRLAVVSSLMIALHLFRLRPIEAMVTLSFASVLLLWTREVFPLMIRGVTRKISKI